MSASFLTTAIRLDALFTPLRRIVDRCTCNWIAVLTLALACVLGLASPAAAQNARANNGRPVAPVVGLGKDNRGAVEQGPVPVQMPGGIDVDQMLSPNGLTPTLKMMVLLTLLSVVPSILVMTTCFVRFIIVFGLLRQALGTQQLPPNQVVSALSLFLTLFVMTPVWKEAYRDGIEPYVNEREIAGVAPGEDPLPKVFENTFRPMQRFMSEQIHKAGGDSIVQTLVDYRRPDPKTPEGRRYRPPETYDDVEPAIIVTAFMLSELKTSFVIGFQIFLPFLVIDMVVSIVLTSMGMMMLPPTLISLPFKLLLFVLIDGWTLTVTMLLRSVDASFG